MVKNTKGGKKAKRTRHTTENSKQIILKSNNPDDKEFYAKVTSILGGPRLMAKCEDGIDRVCVIPGRMTRKKSHWLVRGSYILITLGNYQDGKGYVINTYNDEDVKTLINTGELDISKLKLADENIENINTIEDDVDDGFDFNSI